MRPTSFAGITVSDLRFGRHGARRRKPPADAQPQGLVMYVDLELSPDPTTPRSTPGKPVTS